MAEDDSPAREYFVPLIKALVVHGASWRDADTVLRRVLGRAGLRDDRPARARYLGYGVVDPDLVMGCTASRATAFSWSTLQKDRAKVFTFPLPPSLAGVRGKKRLTTTLAWTTPTNGNDHRYRQAQLWTTFANDVDTLLGVQQIEADYHSRGRGTIGHWILEGEGLGCSRTG